jgi:hypothetical protein
VLLLTAISLTLTSCEATSALVSIQVNPATVNATVYPKGSEQVTWQYTAVGTYSHGSHPTVTEVITDSVVWSSSSSQMVTVSDTGFAEPTGISYGTIQIYATGHGTQGDVVGISNVTLSQGTTSAPEDEVTSLSFKNGPRVEGTLHQAVQFQVVGLTSKGTEVDVTNRVKWTSNREEVASIDTRTGLAQANSEGTAVMIATYKNPDGAIVTGIAPFHITSAN